MKTHRLVFVSLLAYLLSLPLLAEEKSLSDGLRDALYLEEVKRDPAAAASAYQSLLEGYEQQQQFAATALFRLAEIRRAEGRKDEAIALYQRLIAQFPNADTKTKLAKENLAALGAKMPEAVAAVVDKEEVELQRLKKLLDSSPDLVNHDVLSGAVSDGYLRIVEWLIKDHHIQDLNRDCLFWAVDQGNAKMTKLLIELMGDSIKEQLPRALKSACEEGYLEITRILLSAGADPGGDTLWFALKAGRFEVADFLLESGAKINPVEGEETVTPLVALMLSDDDEKVKYFETLIARGADIHARFNFQYELNRSAPSRIEININNLLSLALKLGDLEVASLLIKKGAKTDSVGMFTCIDELNADQLKVAELLIEAGVDPNSKTYGGLALLAMAYNKKYSNLVKLLLAKGANPNVDSKIKAYPDERVSNLTQNALYEGSLEYLLLFLDAGGDPGSKPLIDYVFKTDKKSYEIPLSAVKTLVDKGFEFSPNWRENVYARASNEVRAYLTERFPAAKPKAEEKPNVKPSR